MTDENLEQEYWDKNFRRLCMDWDAMTEEQRKEYLRKFILSYYIALAPSPY